LGKLKKIATHLMFLLCGSDDKFQFKKAASLGDEMTNKHNTCLSEQYYPIELY